MRDISKKEQKVQLHIPTDLCFHKIRGKKQCFFHPKISKICVTWVKSEKGTISYPHRPMFKISWKNCKPSLRYGPDKNCVKKKESKTNIDKNNSLPLRGKTYE